MRFSSGAEGPENGDMRMQESHDLLHPVAPHPIQEDGDVWNIGFRAEVGGPVSRVLGISVHVGSHQCVPTVTLHSKHVVGGALKC